VELFTLLTKHNRWSYLLTKHIIGGVIYLQNI